MNYEMAELTNGLPVILAPVPETPRMALAIALAGGIAREPVAGMAKMTTRLLLKGTERRNAEQLARTLDEHAIDTRELALSDCMVLEAVFLNREFDTALDLLADMLRHSTFIDFGKEATRLAGEINASLDLPAEQASDLLVRTMFAGHPYGHGSTSILEALPALDEAQTRDWHYRGLQPASMNITLVGDFDPAVVLPRLNAAFGDLATTSLMPETPTPVPLTADRVVTKARAGAHQAQVYQGWYAPSLGSTEHAPLAVMNTIFGAGGLSSRLFTELRDKQGLAYSVRSQYMPFRQSGEFIISIGTSPDNIARARQGFADQLARMQHDAITSEELLFAKGRLAGSYVLSHETTSQQCLDLALNHINGLPPDYGTRLLQAVEGVTSEEVQAAAQLIAGPSITAIVAPEEALPAE